jgi:hypothetical protein
VLENPDYGLLQKISEARRASFVIVSVKRDREIRTNTITNSSEAIERTEA